MQLKVKQLIFCAAAVALGTVLSYVKLFNFPTGGSITLLSMLIICLPGYWYGPALGIMTGIAYGVLQLILEPYVIHPMQLIMDYFLAFGALGLCGFFFKTKNGLIKGYIIGILGRYLFSVLSGYIFFSEYAWEGWNPLAYSLVYNAIYIFSEAGVTLLLLLLPPLKEGLAQLKKMALS